MERPLTESRFFQALAARPSVGAIWLHGRRARGTSRARGGLRAGILANHRPVFERETA
ncbi:MAG: hypothetical protein K2X11_10085 [Acetobacteraceae bacterium]|nr:hypothetical protein [Acetobacteraceae bacterium]